MKILKFKHFLINTSSHSKLPSSSKSTALMLPVGSSTNNTQVSCVTIHIRYQRYLKNQLIPLTSFIEQRSTLLIGNKKHTCTFLLRNNIKRIYKCRFSASLSKSLKLILSQKSICVRISNMFKSLKFNSWTDSNFGLNGDFILFKKRYMDPLA